MAPAGILDHAFRSLTAEERGALLEAAESLTYASGDVVLREGATVDSLYVVAKGQVRVTRHFDGTVSAEFVGPRGPGDTLGEMSFVDGAGASATLIADGAVEVLRIPSAIINLMITADKSFAGRLYHSLLLTLTQRLRDTNARVLTSSL